MVKLFILADDFTGALDTGVHFAARGAATRVVTDPAFEFSRTDPSVQVRVRISTTLGHLMKRLLDGGLEATLMCTGGDTLLALMRTVNVAELTPVCELATGVVLTKFVYQGKPYDIISKSGGFGEADLLCRLADLTGTGADQKEDTICLRNTI